MRKTKFKMRDRKTRETGKETAADAGSVKEIMQVRILRRKEGNNSAERYLEVRHDGDGQGTIGFAKLKGLPGFTDSIFRGVVGVGARLPWAEQ